MQSEANVNLEEAVQSTTTNPTDTNNGVTNQQPEPASITALRQAFEAAMDSDAFKRDKKVIEKAIKALEIPDPDARFRKQFRDVAIRNLLAKATKDVNGNVAYPADAAITAEVERLLTNRRAKQATA